MTRSADDAVLRSELEEPNQLGMGRDLFLLDLVYSSALAAFSVFRTPRTVANAWHRKKGYAQLSVFGGLATFLMA